MSLPRLLLFLLLGMMIRRLFLSFGKARKAKRQPESEQVRPPQGKPTEPDMADLTEQGIDDADFEEIP